MSQTQGTTIPHPIQELYIGLDLHKKSWQVCIYTRSGEHKTFTQDPDPETLARYLHRHFPGATSHVAFEAGYGGFMPHRALEQFGIDCMVVHPADVPTTDKEQRRKSDPRDARKLARSLRGGELDPIYVPSDTAIGDRALVRLRSQLVRNQTRTKNRIKGFLAFFGIAIPAPWAGRTWSRPLLRWMASLEFAVPTAHQTLAGLLATLELERQQILQVTRQIRTLSRTPRYAARMQLLRSVPGIGAVSAMIWLTELVDIHRFPTFDHLCSYVGLVPGKPSSADREPPGTLDHRGNPRLRTLLIENSWMAKQKDPVLLARYEHLTRRMVGKNAIIRIGRILLRRMRAVLLTHHPYEYGRAQ